MIVNTKKLLFAKKRRQSGHFEQLLVLKLYIDNKKHDFFESKVNIYQVFFGSKYEQKSCSISSKHFFR